MSRRETRLGDTVGRLAAGDSDAAYNPTKLFHQIDAMRQSFEVYHLVPSLACIPTNATGMQVAYTEYHWSDPVGRLSNVTFHRMGIWEWEAGAVNAGGNAMKQGWKAPRGR